MSEIPKQTKPLPPVEFRDVFSRMHVAGTKKMLDGAIGTSIVLAPLAVVAQDAARFITETWNAFQVCGTEITTVSAELGLLAFALTVGGIGLSRTLSGVSERSHAARKLDPAAITENSDAYAAIQHAQKLSSSGV